MEDTFFLNTTTYNRKYANYKDYAEAIQFSIVLPFQLPIPDESIFSFKEAKELYSLNFIQLERDKIYTAGGLNTEIPVEYFETRVEMTVFTNNQYNIFNEFHLTKFFDELLQKLNSVILTFLIKGKDDSLYKISKEMLDPSILWRHIKFIENEVREMRTGIFMLHMNAVYKKDIHTKHSPDELINFARVIQKNENPFVLSEELYINGKRQYKSGFYNEGIINVQTSIEIFLRTLLTEFLKFEGKSSEEVELIHSKLPFKNMVKKEFGHRIGGSWQLDNPKKEVGNWYVNCYEIRNKIIHGGYRPSNMEVALAIDSVHSLRLFIYNRIKKSKRYEEILKYL